MFHAFWCVYIKRTSSSCLTVNLSKNITIILYHILMYFCAIYTPQTFIYVLESFSHNFSPWKAHRENQQEQNESTHKHQRGRAGGGARAHINQLEQENWVLKVQLRFFLLTAFQWVMLCKQWIEHSIWRSFETNRAIPVLKDAHHATHVKSNWVIGMSALLAIVTHVHEQH